MSKNIDFEKLNIGDSIPELVKAPITRTQLALFAGASGDHNPIHLDDDEAKAGGLNGVIAHGMLNMAFLGQMLTECLPQTAVRSFRTRFAAMAFPGDVVTCKGVISGKNNEGGENLLELDLIAENQNGEILLKGSAQVAYPYLASSISVDDEEMQQILNDAELVSNLRNGKKDAEAGDYNIV